MKKIHVNFLEPPQEQLDILLKYYQAGRYVEAEKLSLSITQEFPKHPFALKVFAAVLKQNGRINESLIISQKSVQSDPQDAEAHSNLGVIMNELGRLKEAEASYRKIIELKPDYAEAHHNLSVMLQKQGRLKEAEASYRKIIELKPDYAEAHHNLSVMLQKQGRLKEAEAGYRKAIELKPDYAEAHSNLGVLLQELGRLDEACSAYIQAINLNPDFTVAYTNLGIAIKNVRFNSSNVKLYPLLIRLLSTGNFARPENLAPSILSLLKHDPLIKNLLLEKNFATSLKEANSIIGSLDKLTLLHHLMRVCPLPDLQFEDLFVNMRSLLLTNLDNIETSPEFIYFLSSLSLHCFTNEYVYVEKDEETELVKNLETEIMQTIAKSKQPEAKKILCLSSYRPLHQYNWYQKLEALDNLEDVKSRLIEEPYAERVIVAEIPMLGEISDDVSHKVRAQYEENPYPRWVKTGISTKAKSISEVCAEVNLHLHSESIKNVIAPAILIAGCGTGQHSIGTASHFSGCEVTAVDLSLTSLAYAKRKTAELGITNLKYLQADILKLDQLEQKFDIIESVGVLHHMDEPMAGWRVLTDFLKPSGLMKIGLYSELARQHIVEVRKEITLLRIGTSESEIREFRRSLAESNDENHQLLTKSSDFFSLSMLRDLIFHVQEHRFTLPQIKNCLDELGLKFCGFENENIISNFREFHGVEEDIYDLALWHQFEESNPRAFIGMYQFWCQKV
jgi:Flp pilus assembly protein TadD/2-polyprenyl-3-methyl-5-hydroxy-6-metoxy-1,4-benzoquinol methylase